MAPIPACASQRPQNEIGEILESTRTESELTNKVCAYTRMQYGTPQIGQRKIRASTKAYF